MRADRATEPEVSRHNCFNALRLGAAVAVLASHSFSLTGRHEPSIGANTIGRIAVVVFFTISGFLITQSWMREPRLGRYLLKRALRILPALVCLLVVTALVLGPLVTTVPAAAYLHSWASWSYIVHNAVFRMVYLLPGVFATNPAPRVVNGSLWTLPIEVHAYLMVAALGLLGLLRTRGTATVVFIAVALASVGAPHLTETLLGAPDLVRAFATGALFFLLRNRIPWRAGIAAPLIFVWVLLAGSGRIGEALAIVAVGYATILVAYHGPTFLQRLTRGRDVSYGIYLWAFPVQQTTALVWAGITPFAMIAIALPVTSLLALASWTLIERPALRRKSFGLPRSPTVQRIPAPVIARADRPAVVITAGAPGHNGGSRS